MTRTINDVVDERNFRKNSGSDNESCHHYHKQEKEERDEDEADRTIFGKH